MTTHTDPRPATTWQPGRLVVVPATVAAAFAVNLVILIIGRAAGGNFTFTTSGSEMSVGVSAVAIMSIIPLTVGMTLTALLTVKWPVLLRVAMVIGPVLALGTIATMTIPADFDTTSTVSLSLMHVALAVVMIIGLRTMGRARTPAGDVS